MPPTYLLARDHLQSASNILQGSDSLSRQLRYIIDRTINLMDETRPAPATVVNSNNILDFVAFRERRFSFD